MTLCSAGWDIELLVCWLWWQMKIHQQFIISLSSMSSPSCSADLRPLSPGTKPWCGSGRRCKTWPPRTACWSRPCAPVRSCRQTEWCLPPVSVRKQGDTIMRNSSFFEYMTSQSWSKQCPITRDVPPSLSSQLKLLADNVAGFWGIWMIFFFFF